MGDISAQKSVRYAGIDPHDVASLTFEQRLALAKEIQAELHEQTTDDTSPNEQPSVPKQSALFAVNSADISRMSFAERVALAQAANRDIDLEADLVTTIENENETDDAINGISPNDKVNGEAERIMWEEKAEVSAAVAQQEMAKELTRKYTEKRALERPVSTESASSSSSSGSDSEPEIIEEEPTEEHMFDVSDLQDREPALISKCGNLEVTFNFDRRAGRMKVTIHAAKDIPTKDRGGSNHNQIRMLLLPNKKVRYKTKIKSGDDPAYEENFTFKVPEEDVDQMGVRFRLYGCERMRRERMIGESVVGFASLNLDTSTTHLLNLEPRSNLSHGDSRMDVSSLSRSDSASSTQSMQYGGMPELLIGLSYNGTTGRLSTEVIKGSNFRNMAMNRAPDTYVKLTLISPNGQEIARSKTSVRRGQPNPLFKETFMFQVALFQLPDVTLMVSVYNKRSMKRKDMIGWFSLGYNNSGEEEASHWTDMRECKGEQVCRWHVLLEA